MGRIRILIAEDSSLFITVLSELIESEPDMELVGLATNGAKAVELCEQLKPDLILMDIHMPVMDGLTATGRIMATCPTPILVVTADPHRGGVDLSFKALSAGALDLVSKPGEVPMREAERFGFLRKMRLLAGIPVVRHVRDRLPDSSASKATNAAKIEDNRPARKTPAPTKPKESPPILGIVASTGGPRALGEFLGALPADFGAPILLVQHITRGFAVHLTRWLDANSQVNVVLAKNGQRIRPGTVYVAPTELQMELSSTGALKVYDGPAVAGYRPSGDVLLRSLARHAAPRAIGLVLSGMGQDGAFGMAALYRSGAVTLVQDEASSVVYSMPSAALERGVVSEIVELPHMATRVQEIVGTFFENTQSKSHHARK
ncbi:chemotaxis-specific protein-glutamate methyltransferase CheB [Bradymonas sediminis]|uniref:chemotaxis-specific protein-glutamate methyltransferase CheB n=1 Tax=Bradymonas sediminis TaxID=1548548 RepID=UPI0010EAAB05|nr:chemotaxis-specific protein-glutamate methyltransferase CheB [Bradymonas sediminis]TDP73838.1 two-component system chemotaxis response regulator CheB [Bradymonas sediminis]